MQMNNAEIKFFRFLSTKLNLSEDDAETFITLQKEVQADSLATKGDLTDLRTALKADTSQLRIELKDDIAKVRTELKSDLAGVRTELKGDITDVKGEMVKIKTAITESESRTGVKLERYRTNILWTVVLFWLAQVGIFLGFAYKLFPGL